MEIKVRIMIFQLLHVSTVCLVLLLVSEKAAGPRNMDPYDPYSSSGVV